MEVFGSENRPTPTLPLHDGQVQEPRATINRLHVLFHSIAVLALLYYRVSRLFESTEDIPVLAWSLIFTSELILSFLWFLTSAFRWRPVSRTAYPERIPGDAELPGIDVFICTADPTKEPTLEVMNTVLSAMCLDYTPEKLSVYLSDDAGSSITLYAIREAYCFAKSWLPFCRKYGLKTRCPEAFFSVLADDDRLHRNNEFRTEEEEIKSKYEVFKERVERVGERSICTNQDRPPVIEIIRDEKEGMKKEETKMPRLVYVSRERRPTYPHRFKAGALNALLRVSGIISNAPYFLVLDCDMYCNDPTSARRAMCFHLDPQKSRSLAFVQFPQIFYNVSKNDIYDSQARAAYKIKWQGMDGLSGPLLCGTGFYMKRQALYGSPKQEDVYLSQPKRFFGPSDKFIESLFQNYESNVIDNGDSSQALLQEAQFLATCAFEKDAKWGDEIGFSYDCLLESSFTGYLLHCKGWTSVYSYPSRPAFLGCAAMNMKDSIVQQMKWSSGWFQIGLSKFCPLTYGMRRMSILQSMCYGYFAFLPLFSVALLVYGIVPQLCLLNAIPLYPKVSNPWFLVFSIVYVSTLCQHLLEVLSSGGTLRTWWNEQRIWMVKSVTSHFFGCLDVITKWIGLKKDQFQLTNKIVDKEQLKKYQKGEFDLQGASFLMVPSNFLVILNMGCFIGGARRMIIERSYDEMFGQVSFSFFILVLSYPIIAEMIPRKKKGWL